MKRVKDPVVGRFYIAVFDGEPVLVVARDTYYEGENRVFAKTCPMYELPFYPTPPRPRHIKLRVNRLRGILRKAEELQAKISSVHHGPLKVLFADRVPAALSEAEVEAIRASTLRRLGEELNALLTLEVDEGTDGSEEACDDT